LSRARAAVCRLGPVEALGPWALGPGLGTGAAGRGPRTRTRRPTGTAAHRRERGVLQGAGGGRRAAGGGRRVGLRASIRGIIEYRDHEQLELSSCLVLHAWVPGAVHALIMHAWVRGAWSPLRDAGCVRTASLHHCVSRACVWTAVCVICCGSRLAAAGVLVVRLCLVVVARGDLFNPSYNISICIHER
jgi:hypothetical protein